MIDEVEELLKSSVDQVFHTMLKCSPHPVPFEKETLASDAHIAGSVGFIGSMTGVVYIYAPVAFAARLAGLVLGEAEGEEETDEMVNDTIGEVTNMIAGTLKTALMERGHTCALTIPSIVRGTNFSVEATGSTTRRVLCFRCDGRDNLVVEILIKPSDK